MINDEVHGEYLSLKELKKRHPGKLQVAIKVRVIRMPGKVNSFMNLMVEDEEKEQVQMCLFDEILRRYRDTFQVGYWYRILDPLLQLNKKNRQVELKVIKETEITQLNIPVQANIAEVNQSQPRVEERRERQTVELRVPTGPNGEGNTNFKKYKYKILRPTDMVRSLSSALTLASQSDENNNWFIVYGVLRTEMNYVSNKPEYVNDSIRKLFNWRCPNCIGNHCHDMAKPDLRGSKVSCQNCNQEINFMWNLRCFLMDEEHKLPCKLNDEITSKLVEMTSAEGLRYVLDDRIDELKQKIEENCGIEVGLYKLSAKMPRSGNPADRYWNVIDAYEGFEKVFEQRAAEQFETSRKVYERELEQLKGQGEHDEAQDVENILAH